eukprot:1996789-Rhodomonas_salina.4
MQNEDVPAWLMEGLAPVKGDVEWLFKVRCWRERMSSLMPFGASFKSEKTCQACDLQGRVCH